MSRFRIGSMLAVVFTALLLVTIGFSPLETEAQTGVGTPAEPVASEEMSSDSEASADDAPASAAESIDQARDTLRGLLQATYAFLPRIGIALVIVCLAMLIARVGTAVQRRLLRGRDRVDAVVAITKLVVYLLGLGAALSVIAGDPRALVGSVGLAGLALSWALQTPIESFSGWLLNSIKGYYRAGDRIEVGDVLGDVYKIDPLTTTVWEIGGPGKPVEGAQPTGALITFPNWEILRSNIVNYTRDFPYVWDELTIGVTNESDIAYAVDVVRGVATRELGERMAEQAQAYRELLQRRRLDAEVARKPQVYVSQTDSWTNLTTRYLVGARERRGWSTRLLLALSKELSKPEHRERVESSYPKQRVALAAGE